MLGLWWPTAIPVTGGEGASQRQKVASGQSLTRQMAQNRGLRRPAIYRAVTLSCFPGIWPRTRPLVAEGSACVPTKPPRGGGETEKQGGASARADVVFERFGELLVNELERKTFLEVSYHPGLDPAERDH